MIGLGGTLDVTVLWLAGLSVLAVWTLVVVYNTRRELDLTDDAVDDLNEKSDNLHARWLKSEMSAKDNHERISNLESFTTKPDSDLNQILGSLSSRIDERATKDSLKTVHVDMLKRLDAVLELLEAERIEEESAMRDSTPVPLARPSPALETLILRMLLDDARLHGILRGSAIRGQERT